jgi:hypothetical protein
MSLVVSTGIQYIFYSIVLFLVSGVFTNWADFFSKFTDKGVGYGILSLVSTIFSEIAILGFIYFICGGISRLVLSGAYAG